MYLSDYSKSIDRILHERIVSPLYGALALSWASWNWKILYFTFFVSETSLAKIFKGTKVDYILENYSDYSYNYWYPVITAILLIAFVPFIANGAYWLDLKFSVWRRKIKNEVNQNQLLTIEESNQLRVEIHKQKESFAKLISEKDLEINTLKENYSNLESSNKETSQFLTTTETALRAKDQTLDSVMSELELLKGTNANLMEDLKKVNSNLLKYSEFNVGRKIINTEGGKLSLKFLTAHTLVADLLLNELFIQYVNEDKFKEAINLLDNDTVVMLEKYEYVIDTGYEYKFTDRGHNLVTHLIEINNLINKNKV